MKKSFFVIMAAFTLFSCGKKAYVSDLKTPSIDEFDYKVEEFADMGILRYRVPDIESLSTAQKELLYYLTEAALQGRDILYDQNCKWNLPIRRALEAVYTNTKDRTSDNFKGLELYLKEVWVSNGIHHHYSGDKFTPHFEQSYFVDEVSKVPVEALRLQNGQTVDGLLADILPVIFDPKLYAKKTNQASGVDLIATSAGNYYDGGITQKEAEEFYAKMKDTTDRQPVMYGLNSKLVKRDGVVSEEVYRIGGLYSNALEKVVYWLQKAAAVAENKAQKAAIDKLIQFYKSGSLKDFDAYSILWVNDTASQIDVVNGFIESYGDPLGMKASWESLVNFKNMEATKRTEIISANAQWFERNSPAEDRFKKDNVKGITAKVITAAILAGDCYPTTPIGINLPNSNWIRAEHGSKSVTIENLTEAYSQVAKGNGFAEEFYWSPAEVELVNKYSNLTSNLHTDLHECLGHGSGQLAPGIKDGALKNYSATLEEARADLFALYYIRDPKLVELGVLPEGEYSEAEYDSYIRNGLLTQVTRIKLGEEIEEDHMRNRALIARWCFENGQKQNVIELLERKGKHYVKINDYDALRNLFGQLLKIVQRIKSTGDFQAGKELVEQYGVKIDPELHKEVLTRYQALNLAPYGGFVNPRIVPVEKDGQVVDATVQYENNYVQQMLEYGEKFSLLPLEN